MDDELPRRALYQIVFRQDLLKHSRVWVSTARQQERHNRATFSLQWTGGRRQSGVKTFPRPLPTAPAASRLHGGPV